MVANFQVFVTLSHSKCVFLDIPREIMLGYHLLSANDEIKIGVGGGVLRCNGYFYYVFSVV